MNTAEAMDAVFEHFSLLQGGCLSLVVALMKESTNFLKSKCNLCIYK